MRITELLETKITQLDEGVNDPAIFKCVFVMGGPGSGKSAVSEKLALRALGFVSMNSDEAFTHLLKKRGLNLKMPPEEEKERSAARSRAKEITAKKMAHALDGRLGLVIDGTGEDYAKIAGIHEKLNAIGYEFYLVVVYADLKTALRRNEQRERSVPEDVVIKKWTGVQRNMDNFLTMFENSLIIDNNGSMEDLLPQVNNAYKLIARWSQQDPASIEAQEWINSQLDTNDDVIEPEEPEDEEELEEPEDEKEPEDVETEVDNDQLDGVRKGQL
jgi:dephospho-CoA kinase